MAVALLALVFVAPGTAAAAPVTRTWTGDGATYWWSEAANWSPAGAPQNGDSLRFPAAASYADATTNNDLDGLEVENVIFDGTTPYSHNATAGATLTINGDVTATSGGGAMLMPVRLGPGMHVFDLDASISLNGPVSGTGGIVKRGAAWLVPVVANSFTGPVDIAEGPFQAWDAMSLGDPSAGTTVKSGASLFLQVSGAMPEPLTVYAPPVDAPWPHAPLIGGSQGDPTPSLTGPVTFTGGSVPIVVNSYTDLRITGAITAADPVVLRGGGRLTMASSQTFAGGVTVDSGILAAEADDAFGSGAIYVAQDSALELSGSVSVANDVSVAGDGVYGLAIWGRTGTPELNGDIVLRGETTFGATDVLAITGAVSGTGPVRIVNPGMVALVGTGTSTWTGGTFVDDGALGLGRIGGVGTPGDVIARGDWNVAGSVVLLEDDQIADSARVEIQGAAGLFDAAGRSDVIGPFVSNADTFLGIVDDGAFISELTTGDTTLGSSITFVVDGLRNDLLRVNGSTTLRGPFLGLDVVDPPPEGTSVVLIVNDGQDAVAGEFDDLAEGAEFLVGADRYAITYRGGDGNDVAIRRLATPPPPTPPPPPPPASPPPASPPPPAPPPPPPPSPPPPAAARSGYWMVGADGGVYAFGDARYYGRAPASTAAVDIERTPSGNGYWVVDALGHVFAFGDASYLGGATSLSAGETVTSMSSVSDGSGYWLFTTRGRAIPFGTAPYLAPIIHRSI